MSKVTFPRGPDGRFGPSLPDSSPVGGILGGLVLGIAGTLLVNALNPKPKVRVCDPVTTWPLLNRVMKF